MFGSVVFLPDGHIVKRIGKAVLIKIPSDPSKAIMVPAKHLNGDMTFWIHPEWGYKVKSGKGYYKDYNTWKAEEIKEAFSSEAINAYYRESYYIIEKPDKIEGEVKIDFN